MALLRYALFVAGATAVAAQTPNRAPTYLMNASTVIMCGSVRNAGTVTAFDLTLWRTLPNSSKALQLQRVHGPRVDGELGDRGL